jgi:CheY-like chemotaxis protein
MSRFVLTCGSANGAREFSPTVKAVINPIWGEHPIAHHDFQIYYHPTMKNSASITVEEPAIAPTRYQTNPPHRILVVDDNSDTRQLSVDVLTGSGYDVEAAKDGAAGWEALQADNYDLVITDNKMPRMTGIEMLEKVRFARMTIPAIMATGNLPTHEFARKPWLRPDATLERPFSNDDLLDTVKNVLRTGDCNDGSRETLLPNYL